MRSYIQLYTVSGFARLVYNTIRTRLFYPRAKIVRFPIDFRGLQYIEYGKGFTTGRSCRIEAYPQNKGSITVKIGENFQMNDYVHITGISRVEIGNNVLIASKVYISDMSHGSYQGNEHDSHPDSIPKERPLFSKPIFIEDNVWIGEMVTVLPGVTIGKGSIIGANSVVSKNIPEFCIAAGNPAHVIKRFNREQNKWERTL
ncbi:MAG: DapH/DapD/GlmU-related protein [Bacteroidales bacterium]|nr:DapH/DapD/GlmU-related protein [Bacteroidales bacterium]